MYISSMGILKILGIASGIPMRPTTGRERSRRYQREANDLLEEQLGAIQNLAQPQTPSDTRARGTCPECLEMMLIGASTCPHCHTTGISWSTETNQEPVNNVKAQPSITNEIDNTWDIGLEERRELIATTQADLLHRRFMGQGAPLGLTRASRKLLSAMDAQADNPLASPSDYLLPSGNTVGDICDEGTFMRVMTEILPNVDANELRKVFDSTITFGLSLKERMEAQLFSRTIFEAMIFEAIQNPRHFIGLQSASDVSTELSKWKTREIGTK
jgi:hypothetical protein